MATTTTGRPGRTLIVLAVLVAGLIALMAVSGTWTPKLGLDLRGGTTITLTAANTTGSGAVDPNSLQLAKTIIQQRVDSLGVGESEVTTSGDKQIIVTVPNVQQDELVRLVGQTAVLRFRAVYAAEQVAQPTVVPTDQPTDQPTDTPTTRAVGLGVGPGAAQPEHPGGQRPGPAERGGHPGARAVGDSEGRQSADAGVAHRAAEAARQGLRQRRTARAPRRTRRWTGRRPTPARRRSRSSPAPAA